MAQIILPTRQPVQQEEKKETALDKLLKGLDIAHKGFGIASNISSLKTQAQARETGASREERAKEQHKIDILGSTQEAEGQQGAIPVTLTTPEGEETTSFRVPKLKEETEDPLMAGKLEYQKLQNEIARKKLADKDPTQKPKSLKPVDIERFGDGRNAINQLSLLRKDIDTYKDKFGPVMGRAGGYNPYDTDAQSVQSAVNVAKQIIGKFLEGGVLRKEDEAKYERILPKLGDTHEVALRKLDQVQALLETKQQANIDTLEAHGYSTEGLGGITTQQMASGRSNAPVTLAPGVQFPTLTPAAQAKEPFNPFEY